MVAGGSVARVRQKTLLKQVVGVAAAYLFAIQVIFVGALAAQMVAATDPQVICHSTEAALPVGTQKTPAQPAGHHSGCPICAFAGSVPPLPGAVPEALIRSPLEIASRASVWLARSSSKQHEPRSSQGPPPLV